MSDWTRRRWIAAAAGVTSLNSIEDMALAFNPAAQGVKRSGAPAVSRPRSRMKVSSLKATLHQTAPC